MLRTVLAAMGALALAACASTPPPTEDQLAQAAIAAAILDSSRPAADAARDEARKPALLLAFAGVKPGQFVGEILPGGGYFTRLLSTAVGPRGKVVAVVPAQTAARLPAQIDPVRAIAANPTYANVTVETPDGLPLPSIMVDLVFTVQNYHDVHAFSGAATVAAMNQRAFEVLKPGGTYLIVDHSAAAGSGARDCLTLHRIDVEQVKREVLAAGFVLEAESSMLANPADPRTASVFDPALRGRTDQFVLRFRKPG
jgi:predicted methyltransferase